MGEKKMSWKEEQLIEENLQCPVDIRKRYLISLVIKEMQVKMMGYHVTTMKLAKVW